MAQDVDALVRALVEIYADASADLRRILGSADSTDFMLGRSERLLAQVDAVVRRLKSQTRDWAQDSLTQAYLDSADAADRSGATFDAVDVASVQVIAEAMIRDVDRAADAIPRELRTILRQTRQEAVRDEEMLQQVARARVLGLRREDLARRIAQTLRDGATERLNRLLPPDLAGRIRSIAEGNYVPIIGKDGVLRRYALDWYANLVGHTWSMAAANEARVRTAERFETDLVQWSVHTGSCERCLPLQGKVFSIGGASADFPPLTDETRPPIHPHCRHVLTPVMADTLQERGQYDPLSRFSRSDRAVEDIYQYRELVVR